MATKETSICLKNAAYDEPIFVLRAQDISSPAIVQAWIDWQKENNKDMPYEKLKSAEQVIEDMQDWYYRRKAN